MPKPELTDGQDNDCDGIVDWPTLGIESRNGGVAATLNGGAGTAGWLLNVAIQSDAGVDAGLLVVAVPLDAGIRFPIQGLQNNTTHYVRAAGRNVDGGMGSLGREHPCTPGGVIEVGPPRAVSDLASDGLSLFLAVNDNSVGSPIYRIELDGGPTAVLIADGGIPYPWFIAVDGQTLWVDGFFEIWRVDATTGQRQLLKSGLQRVSGFVVDATDIYYAEGEAGRIGKLPKDGGPSSILASAFQYPGTMSDDGASLLVGDNSQGGTTNGRLMSVAKATGAKSVLWQASQTSFAAPASDINNVYALTNVNGLIAVPRDGGTAVSLTGGLTVSGSSRPIVESGPDLYVWGTRGSDSSNGIWRVSKTDGGLVPHAIVGSGQPQPAYTHLGAFVLVGTSLYVFSGDGYVRRFDK